MAKTLDFVGLTIFTVLIAVQTRNVLLAQAKVVPATESNAKEISYRNVSNNNNSIFNETRTNRQMDEKDDIDVDGPYGYLPRVVHGVNKIFKGFLNGSLHQVMHGALGIAPDDTADDLISTYNQIMGIPDPEDLDLDLDETTEKGVGGKNKNKVTVKPQKAKNPGSKVPVKVQGGPGKDTVVTLAGTTKSSVKSKGKNKKPLRPKGEDELDDLDTLEDEDDDEDPVLLLMALQNQPIFPHQMG